jgi:hypothetical protein
VRVCGYLLCSIIDAMNGLQVIRWLSVFVYEFITFLILQAFYVKNISINYAKYAIKVI